MLKNIYDKQVTTPFKHRSEIDGLRCVAVFPVIFFHAGFVKFFGGGYVGVDIFFVISGYLISTIILNDLTKKNFSLLNFYERRARRILPALYFVIILSFFFGYFWMLPDEFQNFGQSIVATTLFSNNILLSLTNGYWVGASEFKPLLHTWSLGVEEQYYIFFPVFLLLFWKYGKKWILISLLVLFLSSLILAQWYSSNKPEVGFFVIQTRAWEILLGVFASFYLRTFNERKFKNLLSLLGLILITYSVVFFDRETPFPSLYTLVPTIGTLLIIVYADKGTIVQRLLSFKIVTGIGLISYSAYLFHQPIFAFAKLYSKDALSINIYLFLIIITMTFAFFSWKYIEKPFRNRNNFSRKFIFTASFTTSFILLIIGSYLHFTHGIPSKFYKNVDLIVNDKFNSHLNVMNYNENIRIFKKDKFSNDSRLKILVIGNCNARDFINITNETFNAKKIEVVYRDEILSCIESDTFKNLVFNDLYSEADIIVYAFGNEQLDCVSSNIKKVEADNKKIFYVGTISFGYNLNWLARLSQDERINKKNRINSLNLINEKDLISKIPKKNYISLISQISENDFVDVVDEKGFLISTNLENLTKHGAKYLGSKSVLNSPYGDLIKNFKND